MLIESGQFMVSGISRLTSLRVAAPGALPTRTVAAEATTAGLRPWARAMLAMLLASMLWQIFVGANSWWQTVSLPEHGDKLCHALAFGSLYAVAALLVPRSWRRALLWATLALGAAHEISQIWQPDRTASVADWLADGAGAWLVGRWLRISA